MTSAYVFTVPGEPLGKARPRVTKNGTFTPKATAQAEARVVAAFLKAYGRVIPDVAHTWVLSVEFHRYERTVRDMDNLVKLVMDALNGHAYQDDSQVEVFGMMTTHWVDHRDQAQTVVRLSRGMTEPRPPRSKT